MAYKSKNGKLVSRRHKTPTTSRRQTICLRSSSTASCLIPRHNAHMLPGADAVWLTANPNGNEVTEAHLALMRARGEEALVADYVSGRRRFLFGEDREGHGCARITLKIRDDPFLRNYLELMQMNYAVDAPGPLARIEAIPGVEDWWVYMAVIPPDAFTEVCPVGEVTPRYLEIGKQLAAEEAA